MIRIKWFGLNAFEYRHDNGTFMTDPYVSRDRNRLSIPEERQRYLTQKPDFVLMTHAHWDHLADMPYFIEKSDTVLYASRTACNIMRALSVPEKNLREIHYGDHLDLPGNVKVTVYESRHMGWKEEAEGYDEVPNPALFDKADNWRCGETFAFLIELEEKRILNFGSANMYEPAMGGLSCDVLIGGISRWKEGFPAMLLKNIRFSTLIPCHHDEFTKPLSQFYLRDDLERLKAAIPNLKYRELPVLQWADLF